MEHPTLYRKRIIPEECIELKDDVILKHNEDYILTSWNALKPKKDLHHGYSCYYLKEGYKISKFCRYDRSLMYWYCDIVEYDYDAGSNKLVVTDLLADVMIYPDGFVKVVDVEELADALEQGLITETTLKSSLRTLSKLLHIVYEGDFESLKGPIKALGL